MFHLPTAELLFICSSIAEQEDWLGFQRQPQRFFLCASLIDPSDRKKKEKRFTPLVHPTLLFNRCGRSTQNRAFPHWKEKHVLRERGDKIARRNRRHTSWSSIRSPSLHNPPKVNENPWTASMEKQTGRCHEKIKFAVPTNSIRKAIRFVGDQESDSAAFPASSSLVIKLDSLHIACDNLQCCYRAM